VLLLEAGPDYRSADAPHEMRSPNPGRMLTHPRYSWTRLMARRTEAQPQRLFWRGRGLGGSSAINGQIAIRPPLRDFDPLTREASDASMPLPCGVKRDTGLGVAQVADEPSENGTGSQLTVSHATCPIASAGRTLPA